MSYQPKIERLDGRRVNARYVRHLTTLTPPIGDDDVDLWELSDGTQVQCASPRNDGRAVPVEIEPIRGLP